MIKPIINTRVASRIKHIRQRGFAGARLMDDDAYEVKRTIRGFGWDDGTTSEVSETVETGYGKLRSIGSGGTFPDEVVIMGMSPYRFRLPVTTTLTERDMLIINGREFVVDSVVHNDGAHAYKHAYIRERSA